MAAALMITLRSSLCGAGVLPAALTFLALLPAPVEASEQIMSHADAASFACVLSSFNTESSTNEAEPQGCQTGSCLHPVEVTAQSSLSIVEPPVIVVSAPSLKNTLVFSGHDPDSAIVHSPPLFVCARHHASSLVKRE